MRRVLGRFVSVLYLHLVALPSRSSAMATPAQLVQNKVATAEMCAATRCDESKREGALFHDKVACFMTNGESPMGNWIMLPRTMRGDQVLRSSYETNCVHGEHSMQQVVLLGAGMDGRAWRMKEILGMDTVVTMPKISLFEVDFPHNFDKKRGYLSGNAQLDREETSPGAFPLQVSVYRMVETDFQASNRWPADLRSAGFDPAIPTVWLVEGLMMYLSVPDQQALMRNVGGLSAPDSVVFHDAVSRAYEHRVEVHGAPFIGGSDDYAALWKADGGFEDTFVRLINSVQINRGNRTLVMAGDDASRAIPRDVAGRMETFLVEAKKTRASTEGDQQPKKPTRNEM